MGDVERARSGDIRRWVGDGGSIASSDGSVGAGSSLGASVICTGDPKPVDGETDDTLEYRLLKLLSSTVDAVGGGDGVFSSAFSSGCSVFSGSTVDSRLIPGSWRLVPMSRDPDRSSGLRKAGEPKPRSGVWRNHDGSFDDSERAMEARDGWLSVEAVEAFRR